MEKSDGNASHIEEDEKRNRVLGTAEAMKREGEQDMVWQQRERERDWQQREREWQQRERELQQREREWHERKGSRGGERGQGKRGRAKTPTETAGSSFTLTESDRKVNRK